MSSSLYSISAAARITGKSRTTIKKHLGDGKLSSVLSRDGAKMIDASELRRVYGDDCDFQGEEGNKLVAAAAAPDVQAVQQLLTSVQLQLDLLTKERERERGQAQQHIDHLNDALKEAQQGYNKAMLLLENKSAGVSGWEQAFKSLEERFANQEAASAAHATAAEKEPLQRPASSWKDKYWYRLVLDSLKA